MKTFSALLALCADNAPVPGEFPAQKPVTRSFDVFFDMGLEKNGCGSNRGAGDLRRYRAHYDVTLIGGKISWLRLVVAILRGDDESRGYLFCPLC